MIDRLPLDEVAASIRTSSTCGLSRTSGRIGSVGRLVRHPESIGRRRPTRVRRQDLRREAGTLAKGRRALPAAVIVMPRRPCPDRD